MRRQLHRGPVRRGLAGPLRDGEGILTADLDLRQIVRGKFDLDVVGHYARPDVFELVVDRTQRNPVNSRGTKTEAVRDRVNGRGDSSSECRDPPEEWHLRFCLTRRDRC